MPEPTRYDAYPAESADDGHYIRYSDYAALREKAEAVVKAYTTSDHDTIDKAIYFLEMYLNG